jgi:small subunit ribosomal protein S9
MAIARTPKIKESAEKPAKAVKAHYWESVGRRKTAIARVRMQKGDGSQFVVNGMSLAKYFLNANHQKNILSPLALMKKSNDFDFSVKVSGGGLAGQAEAVRHGVARALLEFDEQSRKPLRASGYLTRDPRAKERRKFGFKKARKSPQWSKR